MAITVELTIRGLCVFVPSEPVQFGDEIKLVDVMTVLVVDARQGRVILQGDRTPIDLEICGHLPLLRYPRPGENKLSGFFLLDGHRIEILDIDAAQPLEVGPSFAKWAQMSRIIPPGQARVDPKFLTPLPPAGIAGILDLEAGHIEGFDSTGVWDFQPPPVAPLPAYRDVFAAAVRVLIPIAGNQAVVRAIARNGSVAFEQVLQPKPNGDSVNLLISNLCFEEEDDKNRTVEGDFAVFYDLLANYNGLFHVPHRIGGPGGGPGTVPGQANAGPSCVGATINR